MIRILLATMVVLSGCTLMELAGVGSETTNGSVIGMVKDSSGRAVPDAAVTLYRADHNPITDTAPVFIDTTNAYGEYRFDHVDTGRYTVHMVQLQNRTRGAVQGIVVAEDTVTAPVGIMKKPGAIKILLTRDLNSASGYVYIPGSGIRAWLVENSDFVVLDSVPCGNVSSIVYGIINSPERATVRNSIEVISGQTTVVTTPLWKFAKRLVLNTTGSGANVAGTVTNFPLLVRLSSVNFNFSEAQGNGEDLLFSKPDGTLLFHEIEQWDTGARTAAVWVKMDTIFGNNATQAIIMSWGKADAISTSNGATVFDTANGFQSVLHLSEEGNSFTGGYKDATVNRNNCTGSTAMVNAMSAGIIGNSQKFIDTSTVITGPISGKITGNVSFTISYWMNYSQTTVRAWVFYFGSGTLFRTFHALIMPSDTVQLGIYDTTPIMRQNLFPISSFKNSWALYTTVYNALDSTLTSYVNGSLVEKRTIPAPDFDPSGGLHVSQVVSGFPDVGFNGLLDELRISTTVTSNDWVRLCYMNQKAQDALIRY